MTDGMFTGNDPALVPASSHIVTAPPMPSVDAKGRPLTENMTERELLVELVTGQRVLADALEEFEKSPMIQAMKSGQNPIMAMMKR